MELQEKLAALHGKEKIMLFACQQAADFAPLGDAATAVISLECAAMLPPSFIDYATRMGAAGVVIAGCREADCEYRLGDQWVQDRFSGKRAPALRAAAPRDRIAIVWCGHDIDRARDAIKILRNNTRAITAIAPVVATKEE